MLASHLAGNEGRVLSFEPTRESFASLLGNISLNNASNVMPVQAAVSEDEGMLGFINHKFSKEQNRLATGALKDKPREIEEVRTVRLDKFLDTEGIEIVDFLKIDVEGAELPVMKSLGQKLSSVRGIYFECRKDTFKQFGYAEGDIFDYLQKNNFKILSPSLKNGVDLKLDTVSVSNNMTSRAGDLLALNKKYFPNV
jgi:FkbM family methyltransferase